MGWRNCGVDKRGRWHEERTGGRKAEVMMIRLGNMSMSSRGLSPYSRAVPEINL
jgi:hypothetical protein